MQTPELESDDGFDPEIPEVVAHLSPDGIHLIVESCPHCRRRHKHGAGRDPKNPLYGHRAGHCDNGIDQPGYILVPSTPANTPPPKYEHPEHILQFFAYNHLPPHLAAVLRPFCQLAHAIVDGDRGPETHQLAFGGPLPCNPERTVALRKLLEAKDAAMRALLAT